MQNCLEEALGTMPYRIALAGGWIDQPFVSRANPSPPGSMVVASIEPLCPYMQRSGLATGTRQVAVKLWGARIPDDDPASLVRELYEAENHNRPDPSGSQDMIGLIYPGINRLDFDAAHEGGVYPLHVESLLDEEPARWLERVLYILPISPRPRDRIHRPQTETEAGFAVTIQHRVAWLLMARKGVDP